MYSQGIIVCVNIQGGISFGILNPLLKKANDWIDFQTQVYTHNSVKMIHTIGKQFFDQ